MEERAMQAIKQLAKEKGVPEEQIVSEMEAAIEEAWRISRQTGKAEIWDAIPRKGEVPTAGEFVAFCGSWLIALESAGLVA